MCRQHIRFSNKVGMFNWRLFSRKTHLWNIAELKRQEEEYDQDYEDYDEQEYDEAADEDNQADDEEIIDIEDTDQDELSSISSGDDTDESDWFDADDWADAPLRQQPPQSWTYYDMQLSFIKFTITQQKLTLTKLHAMRFNPLTNNICRNRHR
jgi:hypothetical protein